MTLSSNGANFDFVFCRTNYDVCPGWTQTRTIQIFSPDFEDSRYPGRIGVGTRAPRVPPWLHYCISVVQFCTILV